MLMLFLAKMMMRTRNGDWAAWRRWFSFQNDACKTEITVVDIVELAPTLKLVKILSENELRTQMNRVFSSRISELTLTGRGLDTYRAHLGDFSYDEWVLYKKCASSVMRWMHKCSMHLTIWWLAEISMMSDSDVIGVGVHWWQRVPEENWAREFW